MTYGVEISTVKQWIMLPLREIYMAPFVELARKTEHEGRVEFHPERWTKTYHQWLDTTPDWCISRQRYYGVTFPIWYCDACGEVMAAVSVTEPDIGSNVAGVRCRAEKREVAPAFAVVLDRDPAAGRGGRGTRRRAAARSVLRAIDRRSVLQDRRLRGRQPNGEIAQWRTRSHRRGCRSCTGRGKPRHFTLIACNSGAKISTSRTARSCHKGIQFSSGVIIAVSFLPVRRSANCGGPAAIQIRG